MKDRCIKKKLLSDYYYGGVEDIVEVERIKGHILKCSRCRSFINSLDSLSSMLPKVPRVGMVDVENKRSLSINSKDGMTDDKGVKIINFLNYKQKSLRDNKLYYLIASIAAIILIIFTISGLINDFNYDSPDTSIGLVSKEGVDYSDYYELNLISYLLFEDEYNIEILFEYFVLSKY